MRRPGFVIFARNQCCGILGAEFRWAFEWVTALLFAFAIGLGLWLKKIKMALMRLRHANVFAFLTGDSILEFVTQQY